MRFTYAPSPCQNVKSKRGFRAFNASHHPWGSTIRGTGVSPSNSQESARGSGPRLVELLCTVIPLYHATD